MHSEEKVASGVAALYLANVVTIVFNTGFIAILTNSVSQQEFGLATLLNVLIVSVATVAVLALPVSASGLSATPPAVTRFLSESEGQTGVSRRRVYLTSLAICAVVSVLCAVFFALPPTASAIAGGLSTVPVAIAAADAVAYSFGQLGAYSMFGAGDARGAGKLIVAASVLRYAAATALLAAGGGLSGVFAGFVVGDLMLAFAANASAFGSVRRLQAGTGDFGQVRRYMASVFVAALVGLAVSQTDKVLAFFQRGLSSIGLYNVASVGAAVAAFAPAAATNILVPALSSYGGDVERKRETVRRYTRYITLISMPMGFGLAALSPFLLQVFGTQYASAAPVMAIISVAIALTAVVSVYASSLLVDGRAHEFTYASVVALAALVLVAVLTVPIIGLTGVAAGRAAMLFVMLAAVAIFARRNGTLVLDAVGYSKALVTSGAMACLIFGSLSLVGDAGLSTRGDAVLGSIVMIPVGLLTYLVGMKLLKGFKEDDIEFIEALVPRRLRVFSRVLRLFL